MEIVFNFCTHIPPESVIESCLAEVQFRPAIYIPSFGKVVNR